MKKLRYTILALAAIMALGATAHSTRPRLVSLSHSSERKILMDEYGRMIAFEVA